MPADVIVMGTHGTLFGSMTNQVVRHATCPVLTLRFVDMIAPIAPAPRLMGNRYRRVLMRILLAIDDSECSVAATHAVIAQFTTQDAVVHVLHADEWPQGLPPEMSFAEGSASAQSILTLHDLRRRDAGALVASAAAQLRAAGFSATSSVRKGDAREAILACVKEWRADLVVLGSHGRKGIDRLILGSVSGSVARHAPCSVEIVRAAPAAA